MDNRIDSNHERWREVWNRKGMGFDPTDENAQSIQFDLSTLLAIDGYDTSASRTEIDNWLDYTGYVAERVGVTAGQKVCEIGCGAGAFIYPFYQRDIEIWGIDYSANLINISQQVMPRGTFAVAEANDIPFDSHQFDVILSCGVFLYFPDLEYTESVFQEIVRLLKPNGRAALLDLNDAAKHETYKAIKIEKLGQEEYDRLYKNHKQMFFSREWIIEMAAKYGFKCTIEDQVLANYSNAAFRFNVFLERENLAI